MAAMMGVREGDILTMEATARPTIHSLNRLMAVNMEDSMIQTSTMHRHRGVNSQEVMEVMLVNLDVKLL